MSMLEKYSAAIANKDEHIINDNFIKTPLKD